MRRAKLNIYHLVFRDELYFVTIGHSRRSLSHESVFKSVLVALQAERSTGVNDPLHLKARTDGKTFEPARGKAIARQSFCLYRAFGPKNRDGLFTSCVALLHKFDDGYA